MEIVEIEIQTDDLVETEIFYSDILGLQLASKEQNSISFLAGQSTLTFVKSNKLNPNYHFAFNIPMNKLEEVILWATSRLNLIENEDNGIVAEFERWNAKAVYFYDNNKNIVEFIARFDLQNSIDKPFDISSIQCISEIGIVSDAPKKLADKLSAEYNLEFFTKGTQSEKFASLGNNNGLFIMVETGRKWFPTEQQAEKHYTRIKISADGISSEIIINEANASR